MDLCCLADERIDCLTELVCLFAAVSAHRSVMGWHYSSLRIPLGNFDLRISLRVVEKVFFGDMATGICFDSMIRSLGEELKFSSARNGIEN